MDIRYCIMCEHEVPVTETVDGTIHTEIIRAADLSLGYLFDIEVCEGPFTTFPPPDYPYEVEEISDHEYELSNIMGLAILESL